MLSKTKGNKRVIIIWAILAILIIGTGIFWWSTQPPSIPNVVKFDTNKKDFSVKNINIKAKKQPNPNKNAINTQHEVTSEIANLNNVGNFGALNDLRGQVEVLRLEVEIRTLQAQKLEIQSKSSPQAIVLPPVAPAIVAPQKIVDLTLPIIPITKIAPKAPSTRVIEISGVGTNISALIRMKNNAIVKVMQGQKFNKGIVKEISRSAVLVQYGQAKTVTLPFE